MADGRHLDAASLEAILRRIPQLAIAVVGDLFLDRYLDLDAGLTEPSIETGLDAYQVVNVRASPGAAGTVMNNLVALGVGRVYPVAVLGDDGEGHELRQALARQGVLDPHGLLLTSERRTPTYTKPMLHVPGAPPRELNRLDIKNRRPLPAELEARLIERLEEIWPRVDAVVVLDQVSEENCGVVTARVRRRLTELATTDANRFVLADSRERIGLFRGLAVKPNRQETLRAIGNAEDALEPAAVHLAHQVEGEVFCTDGERGMVLASPQGNRWTRIPAYRVSGPLDIVGAGDSTSAGIVCARASGASVEAAAEFGNLVASITVQQIGTTGTATPAQVRQRFTSERMKDESARS